jgi:hypothetical protein
VQEPGKKRSGWRWVWLGLGLAFVALALDGIYVGVRLNTELKASADRLTGLRDRVANEPFGKLEVELTDTREHLAQARSLMGHPAYRVASHLPFIGDDATATGKLTDAADLAARAGLRAISGVTEVGIRDPDSAASVIYSDGRVRLDLIERLRPSVAETESLLNRARSALMDAPSPRFGVLADALRDARIGVNDGIHSTRNVLASLDLLPGLLGGRDERDYLLGFQALNEARGTGGVIGVFGVLHAANGGVDLEHIAHIGELTTTLDAPVAAPEKWFGKSYGILGGLHQYQQANQSPDFPTVAKVLLEMYESSTGGTKLDGVLLMDPLTLKDMLPATGPLDGGALAPQIDENNIEQLLFKDAYSTIDPETQNEVVLGLIRDFWTKLTDGPLNGKLLAEGLDRAIDTQHLKIFTIDTNDEKLLVQLHADCSYSSWGPDSQVLFHSNYSVNKVDVFMHRTQKIHLDVDSEGVVTVTNTVVLDNEAPDGPKSLLLQPGDEDDPLGLNRMALNFLLPVGAEPVSFEIDGRKIEPLMLEDRDRIVVWDLIDIGSGESAEVNLTYTLADTVDLTDPATISLVLVPQTLINPDHYEITVSAPEGLHAAVDKAEGTLETPTQISISLGRS